MITLIRSRLSSRRPDLLLLQDFEEYCSKNSKWKTVYGARLIHPIKISSRIYTMLHSLGRPLLKHIKQNKITISLGLPYHIYLFSKTFPYFTFSDKYRVLWTYDVWEPKFEEFKDLVLKAKINLLLLSSKQATEHFQSLNLPGCQVHWIPETINPADYYAKPFDERSIDILSFGRVYRRYHDKIVHLCEQHNINYQYEKLNDSTDVAVKGVNPASLQFPTWEGFKTALSDAKICVCFPKYVTHPDQAGNVSTITLRYLQAMASKCLVIGDVPLETRELFDYDPFIQVDWQDPYGQLQTILSNYDQYETLIERNYQAVNNKFHHNNAIASIEELINARLSSTKNNPLPTRLAQNIR